MVKSDGAPVMPTLFFTFNGYVPGGKLFDSFDITKVILSIFQGVTLQFFFFWLTGSSRQTRIMPTDQTKPYF
jgi:hypothetical protein